MTNILEAGTTSWHPFMQALIQSVHSATQINRLGADTTAWHPLTLEELREAGPLRRAFLRLFAGTPLKLLSSVAEWARGLQVRGGCRANSMFLLPSLISFSSLPHCVRICLLWPMARSSRSFEGCA